MHAPKMNHRESQLAAGIAHHHAGRLDDAATIYQQLHAADARDSEVLFLMGVLSHDLGLFESACRFLDEALALAPTFPEANAQLVLALNALADQAFNAGRLPDAALHLKRALELCPADAATLQGLGRIALAEGDPATAEIRLQQSLTIRPDDAPTLNWLGLARLNLNKFTAAEACLRQTLALQPHLHQARNNLGLVYFQQDRLNDAKACFEAALASDPAYVKARINLALTLRLLERPADARRELETVLAAHPDDADALNNLGVVLQDLGEGRMALDPLTRAVTAAPQSAAARWNLSLTQLQLGDFENGWANFEARWDGCTHLRGGYQMPAARAWTGEDLTGKRLLLWAEQGLGDSIQFVRFAADVAARGATVSVLSPPEIAMLLRGAPGVAAVVTQGGWYVPPYDYHCPLMSLPHRLGLTADSLPPRAEVPYLSAPAGLTEHWRRRLCDLPGLKVGVAWAGNARLQSLALMAVDKRRSIPLARLAPLFAVPGCSFVSLQKGSATRELAAVRPTMHDFSAEWSDFTDTAAVIANLDLVISVDTAVAHLAGALGKPVWLLNRRDSCWRWLLDRDDSPWYPTLRQFRQPRTGDWESVIAAASSALRAGPAVLR